MTILTATIFNKTGRAATVIFAENWRPYMHPSSKTRNQEGFSTIELIVAMAVMLLVVSAVFSLMKNSMEVSATTYQLADAQENLRTAHEYINRDLINAGDGLNSITKIQVPNNFVLNYLSLNPVPDSTPGMVNLAILTSDNNVTANTGILGTNPVLTVRSTPVLTDRLTIMEVDPNFTPIALPANTINLLGTNIRVSAADLTRFNAGEIYFMTSSVGATFCTISAVLPGLIPALVVAGGDPFGLNISGIGGQINTISDGGALQTSLLRMRVIHYYVNSNGLLVRRVFGVKEKGFTDSVIAENVVSLQFRYFLMRDGTGDLLQPVAELADSQQQLSARQVEVTITTETPQAMQNGSPQQLTMTTSTSLRNVQYRENCRNNLC
jgi:type II secretory pathway pseudopilin PulG